jgi:hypothetical protein
MTPSLNLVLSGNISAHDMAYLLEFLSFDVRTSEGLVGMRIFQARMRSMLQQAADVSG